SVDGLRQGGSHQRDKASRAQASDEERQGAPNRKAAREGLMPVVFHIPGYLRQFTEGQKRVPIDVPRRVVRDALDCLSRKYPGVRDRILTESGDLRRHVNIFVATESIRYTGALDTPIGEGEEVSIGPAVGGGSAPQCRTISV